MEEVILDRINYKDYGECIKLSNKIVELVITVEVGPRIIRYGFAGGRNELCDDAPMTLSVLDEEWRLMGGHRLLHCPEEYPRTYEADNLPVEWHPMPNGAKVIYVRQKIANIRKEMEITLSPDTAEVKILHRLINNNAWAIKIAPWACTVMEAGGVAIVPFGQSEVHFKNGAADARNITFWAYTDVSDKRIGWGKKYVTISYDSDIDANLKIGFSNKRGWGGYINKGHLFTVEFDYIENVEYPDNGCSFEVFSCDFMTEIETLAPYKILKPREEITHIEQWNLFDNANLESQKDESIDKLLANFFNVNTH